MPDQLESALVLSLRDTIKWESSLDVSSSGTLTPVNPAADFDQSIYQRRDRELAFRDLITSAAVVEVAVQVSDVYNFLPDKPMMQGPVTKDLPFNPLEITSTGTNLSQVRHVRQVSIPWDAARYADADLYGRDTLVYEILARACQQAFLNPSISRIDPNAVVVNSGGSVAWSLAEGVAQQQDINTALPLNRDLFKVPDQNLADRDNLIAAYAARLMQVLKNPFDSANRLYVKVDGGDAREPEIYTYVSTVANRRIWLAEPTLSSRNRIVYDTLNKTLQWTRERTNEVHPPQIFALSIPGIEVGQTVSLVTDVPDTRDAQFWRGKAGRVVPSGDQYTDTSSALSFTANGDAATGGVVQIPSASLTVPGILTLHMNGSVGAGRHRVSALVVPSGEVEIAGAQNVSNTSGTLAGATYEINVPSGSIASLTYQVNEGDGIIYNGTTVLPGNQFDGIGGVPNYSQAGATTSSVRQARVAFSLALPPGAWAARVEYTNITGISDGFNLRAQYTATGQDAVDVITDAIKQSYSGTNGRLFLTPASTFVVEDDQLFNFSVFWTGGNGQFHLRRLIFENTAISSGSYYMNSAFGGDTSQATITADINLPQVVSFIYNGTNPIFPVDWTVNWQWLAQLPIQFRQVDVQTIGTYATTPVSSLFQGWRQECLERAERVIQQGYNATVKVFGTAVPTFRDSGSNFSTEALEGWMGFAEVFNPRLRELTVITPNGLAIGRQYEVTSGTTVYGTGTFTTGQKFYATTQAGTVYSDGTIKQVGAFKKSRPGHFGKPALIPYGLYIDTDSQPKAYYDTPYSTPVIAACQPWMIDLGVYVAQDEFWMPDNITVALTAPDVTEVVEPFVTQVVTDGANFTGEFREGSLDLAINSDAAFQSMVYDTGTLFDVIVFSTGSQTGTMVMSFDTGTLFDVVQFSSGTQNGTQFMVFDTGTLFDVVVSSTGTQNGTSVMFFDTGTLFTVTVDSGTYVDSVGTFSGGFYAGTYA